MTELNFRPYRDEQDYWRIRAFLREVMLINDRRELSWHVARLDYWRWHVVLNCGHCGPVEDTAFIWETASGEIAAVLNPEGRGEAHLQMHPAWRTPQLAEAMLDVAEERLPRQRPEGGRRLLAFFKQSDQDLHDLLIRRGYAAPTGPNVAEHQRRRILSAPVAAEPVQAPAPPGYSVRALGDVDELPARSWASWRAFHPAEPDEAYEGWEWYHNIQRQPLYRRDLDIVAVPEHGVRNRFAPTGEMAAFCTAWYDDVTRTAYFEPVGAAPEHQRRGLGRAVLTEALRRLERMGCVVAFVGGYSLPANALYASAGFEEYDLLLPLVKEWE